MPNTPNWSFTNIVRAGVERACRDFTSRVEPLGFLRTLKMFWTRRHPLTVDFIHFHRGSSTYGAPRIASVDIRVHFGIRVLNDDFVAAALNGPHSDAGTLHAGRYHLRFNAETGSTYDRCIDDLARFVVEQGEPWFQRWSSVDALLQSDSPLRPQDRASLRTARDGQTCAEHVAASLKILGIKET
jgi:hypothetical protein